MPPEPGLTLAGPSAIPGKTGNLVQAK